MGLLFLDRHHPLGAGARNVALAFGVFWNGKCEGVLTFGHPVTNHAVTRFGYRSYEVLELRKMWMTDKPPANSESRAMSICVRLIRQHYPARQLLITYCDAEEKAAAYRGCGWIPMEAVRSMREVMCGGVWLTVRDANRRGIYSQRTDCRYECRRKWLLPLTEKAKLRVTHELQKDQVVQPPETNE